MAKQTIVMQITGVSPLLMNNPASMKSARPEEEGVKVKYIPTPEEEAAAKVYRLTDDSKQLYVPSLWFRSSLLNGCKGRRLGKIGAGTVLSGAVFNADDKCLLVYPKTGKPIVDYAISTMRSVVQKAGVMRSRPQLEEWGCKLALEIDLDFVTPNIVVELLNIAGRVAGVGDYRPERKGPYGRYSAELLN